MAKKKSTTEEWILVAIIAVVLMAPLYCLYQLFGRRKPLVKDPDFYALTDEEMAEFVQANEIALGRMSAHMSNSTQGLRTNKDGSFDRRSAAGKQAQTNSILLQGAMRTKERLRNKPKAMFHEAVIRSSEINAALLALFAFFVMGYYGYHFSDAAAGARTPDDLWFYGYLYGGITLIPTYFSARYGLPYIIYYFYKEFVPPIVELTGLPPKLEKEEVVEADSVQSGESVVREPSSVQPQHAPSKPESETAVKVGRINAPEDAVKALKEDSRIAALSCYYCIPGIELIVHMKAGEDRDAAMHAMRGALVAQGWPEKIAARIFSRAEHVYASQDTKGRNKLVTTCRNVFTSKLLSEMVYGAFLLNSIYGEKENRDKYVLNAEYLGRLAVAYGLVFEETIARAPEGSYWEQYEVQWKKFGEAPCA